MPNSVVQRAVEELTKRDPKRLEKALRYEALLRARAAQRELALALAQEELDSESLSVVRQLIDVAIGLSHEAEKHTPPAA